MSTKNETRTLNATLRTAPDSTFELAGTAVAYNTLSGDVGGFRERFLPGAFTRVLQTKPDVKALLNHDANIVLGRTTSGTLVLSDSPQGLNFVVRLDPNQQSHRDLHAAVKRQDISQCSFAFRPEDNGDDFDDAVDEVGQRFIRRTVKAAKLFDISIVTYPAYPQGTSVHARSANYVVAPRRAVDPWAAERAALAAIDKRFAADRQKAKEEAFKHAVQYREIKNAAGETINFEPVTLADLGISGMTVAEYLEDVLIRRKADEQMAEIRRDLSLED